MKKKIVVNWSGGKDAALSLKIILENKQFQVVSLLTTIHYKNQSSSVHFIPKKLLEKQAESIGLPIHFVELTQTDLKDYNQEMQKAISHFKELGVTAFAFGDIYVDEVLPYRASLFTPLGIELIFPLRNKMSEMVMDLFLESSLKALLIVTHQSILPCSFIGKQLNKNLIKELPDSCDVCGENGEYHTFVFGGSIFKEEIAIEIVKIKKYSQLIRLSNNDVKEFTYCYAVFK